MCSAMRSAGALSTSTRFYGLALLLPFFFSWFVEPCSCWMVHVWKYLSLVSIVLVCPKMLLRCSAVSMLV